MTDAVASASAATAISGAATSKPAAKTELDKLKAAAKGFEAIMLRQMIGSMRSASLGEGMFDSSQSEQFREMNDAKMADQMAAHGGLHIADMLVKQFGARLGGTATAPPATAAVGTTGKADK